MNPRFPVYIVSKGRWESRLTSKAFEAMGVPYRIVVEEEEHDSYCSVIDPKKILVLDKRYQDAYDPCDNLGSTRTKGSGPARNFVWDHAAALGAKWHWCVDDNIRKFYRLNKNLRVPVDDGTIFRCMEDFVLRYENVAMAGPHYFMFATRKYWHPPLVLNHRIYSCNLIRNDVPFRWRARFNEDTDLSLRMLKAGWCTVLFFAFLQEKMVTRSMSGGNTELYRQAGTLAKSEMLAKLHPDVARITYRYHRWHHYVDYRPFEKMPLKLKRGAKPKSGIDDYGMKLKIITPDYRPRSGASAAKRTAQRVAD